MVYNSKIWITYLTKQCLINKRKMIWNRIIQFSQLIFQLLQISKIPILKPLLFTEFPEICLKYPSLEESKWGTPAINMEWFARNWTDN